MPILRCPVCKKSFDSDLGGFLPFCSQRCKQIDLARWLDERYGLAYEQPEQTEDQELDEI